jgi:hypothetical protein
MRFTIPGFTYGLTDEEVALWERTRLSVRCNEAPDSEIAEAYGLTLEQLKKLKDSLSELAKSADQGAEAKLEQREANGQEIEP